MADDTAGTDGWPNYISRAYEPEPFPLSPYQPPEQEVWHQPDQPEPQLTSRERQEIRAMLNWWKGRT